jgi:riboflavin kinase/FMN adenylyltransferase
MKVHWGLSNIPPIHGAVLTVGTFDGVHGGHRRILERIRQSARDTHGESVILTFHPHPRSVLGGTPVPLLQTPDEKIQTLEALGIDHLIIVPFTAAFASMPAPDYVRDILINPIHPKRIIIGYDHQFGKNREGNYSLLKQVREQYGFELEEITAEEINDCAISSTQIRKALNKGDVSNAAQLLGRPYSLSGVVVHGEQRGRLLGFPTANLQVSNTDKLIPANGVYVVETMCDGMLFRGMMNIGHQPTFHAVQSQKLEVHVIDQAIDLYGKNLTIRFLDRLRNEEKFSGRDALVAQLERDRDLARNWH